MSVTFTDAAGQKILSLIEEERNYNLKLRVYITGGGCSGYQYGFAFINEPKEDDYVFAREIVPQAEPQDEKKEVQVVVDVLSMMYLEGAQIDYVEKLQGAHFTVNNPNAQTTCSCGSSFSLPDTE